MNKLQRALSPIKADDALKQRTADFITQKAKKQTAKPVFRMKYALAATACVLLFGLSLGGYSFYSTPVSYISLDINPSVELSLNRSHKVVAITPYNEDAQALISGLELEKMPYIEALDTIAAKAEEQGYLSDGYSLEYSVVSGEESRLISEIEASYGYQKYDGSCHSSSASQMSEAHENGLSFGKYEAYLELKEYSPETTASQCKDMSMGQIRTRIEECKDHEKTNMKNSDAQSDDHGHKGFQRQHRNGHEQED